MEKEKLGMESAFPTEGYIPSGIEGGQIIQPEEGISKRFYAACAAMQGILSNEDLRVAILADQRNGHKDLAGIAYEYADELLKKENQ